MAKKRHAGMARLEGAATGIGGIITCRPGPRALAWIQSRLVFFVAAAYGYDPHDPMRPAELLVLRDLYTDPQTARQALDGMGGRSPRRTWAASSRARATTRRRRAAAQVRRQARRPRAARRLIPGVAIAFNAVANERDTRALADKASRFYGG